MGKHDQEGKTSFIKLREIFSVPVLNFQNIKHFDVMIKYD